MSRLLIVVPRSRRTCGRATLIGADGTPLLAPLRILATSSAAVAKRHGNPTRDRTLPFGHPPQGQYVFAGSVPPGYFPKPKRARQFGKSGAILLTALGGEALEAKKKGRRLFYLHGGPSDRRGRLRPTRGGFRMLDADLTALLAAINDAHVRGDSLQEIEVVDVRLPGRAGRAERALTRKRRLAAKARRAKRREKKNNGDAKDPRGTAPSPNAVLNAPPLALPAIALAVKLLGNRQPNGTGEGGGVSRRNVIALALLITTVSACCEEDRRSYCEPVACDPRENTCPPPRCTSSGGSWGGSRDITGGDTGGGG